MGSGSWTTSPLPRSRSSPPRVRPRAARPRGSALAQLVLVAADEDSVAVYLAGLGSVKSRSTMRAALRQSSA
jgi:hypothetical protein